MKPTPPTIPDLYTKWLQTGWATFAEVAAEQEWEDEGGSIEPPKKPQEIC